MRAYKSAVFALVAFALGALPVGAQDAKTAEARYVALRFGRRISGGAAARYRSRRRSCRQMWPIVVARRSTR